MRRLTLITALVMVRGPLASKSRERGPLASKSRERCASKMRGPLFIDFEVPGWVSPVAMMYLPVPTYGSPLPGSLATVVYQ
jgi:hypothetical protein